MVSNKNISVNTPKSGYVGTPNVRPPGAFQIKRMDFIGIDGKGNDVTRDIKHLVESFTITSELFSPVVTFSASVRDNENLFSSSDFKICGQEKIVIEIDPLGAGDAIRQTFFVKEYPTLVRTLDFPNIQIYTLLAISEFAYRSSLMNICRPIDDGKSLPENIGTIFKDDLGLNGFDGLEGFVVYGDAYTKFKGNINIQRPLQAAEWIRSRTFEENGSPFFLHNDITKPNTVFMSSWEYLSKQSANVATYYFKAFNEKTPGTAEYTEAERKRILSMTSNFKFDRLGSANSGAYASRVNVTDFSAKAYYTLDFKGEKTADWNPRKYRVKTREGIVENLTMHENPSASITSLHVNRGESDAQLYNSATSSEEFVPFARALYARLNETNHEIVVYGDTVLQSGHKIELKVPKPTRTDASPSEEDPVSSGKYVILVSAFIFSDGVYKNKLKLAKLVPSVTGTMLSGGGSEGEASEISTSTTTVSTGGGKVTPSTAAQKEYYDKTYNAIYKAAVAKGVPNPDVVARLGAAQSALETGWGQRTPPGSNNYFGIKGSTKLGSSNTSTQEVINGKTITIKDNFRVYASAEESAADYVDFLVKNKRYKPVLASTNISDAVSAIGKSGYATSPVYAQQVGSIANKFLTQ